MTDKRLLAYEKYFAICNRSRRPSDLIVLGVADEERKNQSGTTTATPTRAPAAISNAVATVSWTGLQSFTGDYNFQVEFPRDAGAVLSRILSRLGQGNRVDLICEDGEVRQFIFRYYEDNGMFRLNVPNSAPNATWAREQKQGIAVVELNDSEDAASFRIIRPGGELQDVIQRSLALGTWGRTSTRLYGWY